ncbi:hypothetical protein LCGC14_2019620 [marine sediment metagenome]|uniref:Uncharacterized protein n=1 Tax=marine sediment metagenome TaxID=412755 RepID=A0A0F9HB81_9ZZZZ
MESRKTTWGIAIFDLILAVLLFQQGGTPSVIIGALCTTLGFTLIAFLYYTREQPDKTEEED